MKVVGILQARMGSTRLAGKVLTDLAGAPLLERCLRRAQRAERMDELWVATSSLSQDDAVAQLAQRLGVPCFRGSAEDVLDRYQQAAQASQAEVVVRLTGDNPLIDPAVVDQVIAAFLQAGSGVDYACNRRPRTFPLGLDVEVFSTKALQWAWREDHNLAWREHVTPYILHHTPAERLISVQNPIDYGQLRWTVDTPEDLQLVRRIYEHFGHDRFDWQEALELVLARPQWGQLNTHVVQREVDLPAEG